MREIKFRAWIDGENMVFSDMRESSVYEDDEIIWDIHGGLEIQTMELMNEIIGGEPEQYEAYKARGGEGDEVIFMQYTGLKDKNGIEIYEGDIVKVKALYGSATGVVGFNESSFVFKVPVYSKAETPYRNLGAGWYGVEVTGNIYENPELLEKPNA